LPGRICTFTYVYCTLFSLPFVCPHRCRCRFRIYALYTALYRYVPVRCYVGAFLRYIGYVVCWVLRYGPAFVTPRDRLQWIAFTLPRGWVDSHTRSLCRTVVARCVALPPRCVRCPLRVDFALRCTLPHFTLLRSVAGAVCVTLRWVRCVTPILPFYGFVGDFTFSRCWRCRSAFASRLLQLPLLVPLLRPTPRTPAFCVTLLLRQVTFGSRCTRASSFVRVCSLRSALRTRLYVTGRLPFPRLRISPRFCARTRTRTTFCLRCSFLRSLDVTMLSVDYTYVDTALPLQFCRYYRCHSLFCSVTVLCLLLRCSR